MALIKSYSNYILKKKHQNVTDGTIYERDITTIGGIGLFSDGQTPIYRSNNFVLTVREDGKIANQYNLGKWEENENGNVWTLENISGLTSEFKDENSLKIILKQDYYDFRDFAYYGSLSELFRVSINDIVSRFPGELYGTPNKVVYYTQSHIEDGQTVTERVPLGRNQGDVESAMTWHEVSNPFGIDIHSNKVQEGENKLKFFANDGYKEYELVNEDTNEVFDFQWETPTYSNGSCKGELVATITLKPSNGNNIIIEAWIGDNNSIYYLSETCSNLHIRPKEKYISEFYNECDNFQLILMNRKTTPKYKATFSVIKENDYGYYRELEDFIFPTTYGGYNINVTEFGLNHYVNRLVEIGTFYDERFTDNMWRSLTHEAIKNFDWTYTREYQEGDEEEYVEGGQKMQKALRLFAREFDDIIAYIDNIKNGYRITYDERNNLPDYFLKDAVENEGWDVRLIYPYTLTEYTQTTSGKKHLNIDSTNEKQQLTNTFRNRKIIREFSQSPTTELSPYSSKHINDGSENGYFLVCCTDGLDDYEPITEGSIYEKYKNSQYIPIRATSNVLYDSCAFGGKGALKNKIKGFTDEIIYTHKEVNDEFMRRLKINSKNIWRHKGTLEGIEMILGMFGLKSKRFVERLRKTNKPFADYEIKEYTSFANYITEQWDVVHQMYRIDWINSTKTIEYDNRLSLVDNNDMDSSYYRGIPVAYRDIDNSFMKLGKLGEQETTSNTNEAFVRGDKTFVKERRLYPNFNTNERYDGGLYYQMNGGWLSKKIQRLNTYNFQYDNDNNIVYTNYEPIGSSSSDDFLVDNEFLYKETVRNVRRTDTVNSLFSIPLNELNDGIVYYVTSVDNDIAVIDGEVFKINTNFEIIEKFENNQTIETSGLTKSVQLIKKNGYLTIGDKFFGDGIKIYDKNGTVMPVDLTVIPDGYPINAYIINDKFICMDIENELYGTETFGYITSGSADETNYFVLDDTNYANALAVEIGSGTLKTWTSGWRRLKYTDKEYLKLNTIENYYKGNNGHNGNMNYDNGHEYFTYFKQLFKYPLENDLFDFRCYDDYYYTLDNEIGKYGFTNLINDNEYIKQYDNYLVEDSKIHFFGNYKKKPQEGGMVRELMIYGENQDSLQYHINNNSGSTASLYILNDNNMIGGSPYSSFTNADEVSNQIVNNKRLTIKFNLHNVWYKQQGQEEIKYLDDIVMNYLTQMIPSTTILDVVYVSK